MILSVGISFACVYYIIKYMVYKSRSLFANYLADGEQRERNRQREELKLQIRDPWRKKLLPQAKKPYFNHVEAYRESGLYRDGGLKY